MTEGASFGRIVKERRQLLGLTQAELGRRVGCAAITIRKIEADTLRPSVQVAEHLAVTLTIPEDEQFAFVRLARLERDPTPIPTPSPAPEEIGQPDLSGRAIRGYQLHNRLGVGSHGAVYRALQPNIEREVAVKIILPNIANDPEFIRRFETEAQLVARLEHPHIVPLYDYWREPNAAYLIMRYLRVGSLEERIKAGPLTDEMTLALLEQLCVGLHTAHRAGVIHRDIKPANILLDEDDNAYLADFGIAKNIADDRQAALTQDSTILGSPAYISPEQILAEPLKPQTDIYSLGVVLYELLTGRKPFQGPTPVAYIQHHLNDPLPLLARQDGINGASEIKAAIPTPLDIVIGRATAKDPQARYDSILSFLADLHQALTPGSKVTDLMGAQSDAIPSSHIAALIDLPDLENPYKGLHPFYEADADDFFGRETLIQALLARMGEVGDLHRFLAVIGPSGSGKSSVVRAGLLPALRQGGLPGSEHWFMVEMIPGTHPLQELEAALIRVAANLPSNVLALLQENTGGLLRAVQYILPADQSEEKPTELVLVIDQFEEVFTLITDDGLRRHFLESLVIATLDPRSRLRVVITLRSDFMDRSLQYADFGDLVRQRAEFVLPLMPDELEQAIVEPTGRAGLELEPGLTATIIDDIGDEPGTLPLLQYALTELFERREGRLLTLAAYQASGGVLGALARRADELYNGLNEAGQEATRQLFLRLITLGEGVEDTRRRVLRSELSAIQPPSNSPHWGENLKAFPPAGGIEGGLADVITRYGRYRLLTFDHDPATRGPTVEVAHEALIREWGRLGTWLDDSRDDIRLQRLMAQAALEWREAGQDDGFLLRDARLDQFEGWAENTKIALIEQEQTFLEASLTAHKKRQSEEAARERRELETLQKLATSEAQAANRFRWLTYGLAVFLIVALGLSWFAFNQRNEAQANADRADENAKQAQANADRAEENAKRAQDNAEEANKNAKISERIRLAAQAQIALDNGEGGDLPALLALRSLSIAYSPEADAALLTALSRGFTRQQYLGHNDEVRHVTFSQDGQTVLTSSYDGTVRLWDTQTGREIRQFVVPTLNPKATLSPDGRFILAGGQDGIARLLDVETGREVRQFSGHLGMVYNAVFSPDGQRIATSDDRFARVWDVNTGEQLRLFEGHTAIVGVVHFSPDGRYLSTGSVDKTARIWDVQTGQELRKFEGHTECACGAIFSPDGRYLLTASPDRTARLWDIQTGQEFRRFIGHTDRLSWGSFSPDGKQIVTASRDQTARLWDIESGEEVRQFLGHTGGIVPASFSPDGQYILTGSEDRTAKLWDVSLETEPHRQETFVDLHETSSVLATTLSSDGQYVLKSGFDGLLRLWSIQTGVLSHEIKLDINTGAINAFALSADYALTLTGSDDGSIHLWETQTGQEVHHFTDHKGPVWDVAFSPNEQAILSGGEDQIVRLREIETGQILQKFVGHQGAVRTVSFLDEHSILTGGADNVVRLWDIETGQERLQLEGHINTVRAIAVAPDERLVLTGGDDDTARLWDVETGQLLHTFEGHADPVLQVAFSPDGRYVLTGSTDQTARLWDVETGDVVRQFIGHISPLFFVGFSADGKHVLTGDTHAGYVWRRTIEEVIDYACQQLFARKRDLTAEEQALYKITNLDEDPTCQPSDAWIVEAEQPWIGEPIYTPVFPMTIAPLDQPPPQVINTDSNTDAGFIPPKTETLGVITTHRLRGEVKPVPNTTAKLMTDDRSASLIFDTAELVPGNAYTAWWVIVNNPAACENIPCTPADVLGRTDTIKADMTYATGQIANDQGRAIFEATLTLGDLPNGWFGNGFSNPRGAEFHVVLHDHGPVIDELKDEMLSTFRAGCTEESIPVAFPPTAFADGTPGPNECIHYQLAIFQQ